MRNASLVRIGLAFLEGLALIVSPCILPVLPFVLSGSVYGGNRRPYGIILGFIFSFTTFALLSRKLVSSFGLDLEIVRNTSLFLLFAFGLILLFEKLSEKFSNLTQKFANTGSSISSSGKQSEGLIGGFFLGCLIGLIWTPCAGPLLAAVLIQIVRQSSDLISLAIILSFVIGAALPMLFITLAGKRLVNQMNFLKRNGHIIRKAFGILIISSVLYTIFAPSFQLVLAKTFGKNNTNTITTTKLINPLPVTYRAPAITGIHNWINSEPLNLENLKGKVVLIDFWTYSCINCVRTLPSVINWYEKYKDNGFIVIGIHAPEFEFEKKLPNVQRAVKQYGIKYPIALDNDLQTWNNFQNRYWPAHYLIDKSGKVVYVHFGEGHYDITENNIRFLLGLNKLNTKKSSNFTPYSQQTPETYLGYKRLSSFYNASQLVKDKAKEYTFEESNIPLHNWSLSGSWKINNEKIVSAKPNALLQIHFKSRKVYLVMGAENTAQHSSIQILLNGKPLGSLAGKDVKNDLLEVKANTLYELVDQQISKEGLLEIKANKPGLEAYAFTFGE